jgi:Ca-activated chloride channel family protein
MTHVIEASLSEDLGRSKGRTLGSLLGIRDAERAESSTPGASVEVGAYAFPLRKVTVRAEIVGDSARSVVEHVYSNGCNDPLDVTHIMPLPASGAVAAFEIRTGGRVVRGVCKESRAAVQEFDAARERGQTAAVLEEARKDVHILRLANVPPRCDVTVTITVAERLRSDAGRFEWRFPTTIAPKYLPGEPIGHSGDGVLPDTDRAPDASRLQPPLRLADGTELELELRIAGDVTEMAGSVPLVCDDRSPGLLRLAPQSGVTCNRDVVVRFWSRQENAVVRAWRDGDHTLVVVDPPATRQLECELPRDLVFLLDRSGSMEGKKLEAAKRALARALRELTDRDSLQIISFSSDFERFRAEPIAATADHRTEVLEWLDSVRAGGGTEVLKPLAAAITPSVPRGRVRTVVFITDGQVANDGEIRDLVSRRDPAVRLYAIGIDTAPASDLLASMARRGQGEHLLLGPDDDIEAEISRFSSALLGPIACGVTCVGQGRAASADLFAGRSSAFFVVGNHEKDLEVVSQDGRFRQRATVQAAPFPLGSVWAASHVERLEDQILERPMDRHVLEKEIVEVALKHQIQTRLTSFLAVDEASQVSGDARSVSQPAELPAGWSVRPLMRACKTPGGSGIGTDAKLKRERPARVCFDVPDQAISNALRSSGRLPLADLVTAHFCIASPTAEVSLRKASRLELVRMLESMIEVSPRSVPIRGIEEVLRLLSAAWAPAGPLSVQIAMRWLFIEFRLREAGQSDSALDPITAKCIGLLEQSESSSPGGRFLRAYRDAIADRERRGGFDAIAAEVIVRN